MKILEEKLKWFKLPDELLLIPEIDWPHFTFNIKDFYTLNKDKFKTAYDASKYIYEVFKDDFNLEYIPPFVNFYFNDEVNFELPKLNWTIIVDYSSPNIAKEMSVWHLRSTILGEFFARLFEYLWAKVIRWNYIWDWWTPFWKLIYSRFYHKDKYNYEEKLSNDPLNFLWFLYSSFKDIEDLEKEDKARYYFYLLSKKDPIVFNLWENFRKISLNEYKKIYDILWIDFDLYEWEAFIENYVDEVLDHINQKWILKESQWTLWVYFDNFKPVNYETDTFLMLKKSDWTSLYALRDLALIYYRIKNYTNNIYYVVWKEQSEHFKLVFNLAQFLWYEWNFIHIPFWLVLLWWQKMSSRKWNIVRLIDLINLLKDKTWSLDLAISALVINDLKTDKLMDVNFDIDRMTSVNWDTWVYLQYTRVRILSLLEKLDINEKKDLRYLEKEKNILINISYFPLIIKKTYFNLKPNLLVWYLFRLSKIFNNWYSSWEKIINLSNEEKAAKKRLLLKLKKVFDESFYLLNLPYITKI